MDKNLKPASLSLVGAVAMGTGVMIGAGIFALTGQIAELAGNQFVWVFVIAGLVTSLSAHSYVKMSNAFPSAGGIAMFLHEAYGRTAITASAGLLMALSMVINESLVARTFGTYAGQLFGWSDTGLAVSVLSVAVILAAFVINLAGNRAMGLFSTLTAVVKVVGLAALAVAGFWAARSLDTGAATVEIAPSRLDFVAALALGILAFKGFTTITNSGGEIANPHRNVGRAIIWSIAICVVVYVVVALAVSSSLDISQIIAAKNFALAEAARPTYGDAGRTVTIILALIATASGLVASVFAVSRMLGMLTDMKLIPHRHFGMPGSVQSHTLVFTVVIAIFLTIFFDLTRIASLGAILYLVMDIIVHWGVLRYLRQKISANSLIVIAAILFDVLILGGLIAVKFETDPLLLWIALGTILTVYFGSAAFIKSGQGAPASKHRHGDH